MVLGTLYGQKYNFRSQKILVAAKYSGKKLELKEDFSPKDIADKFSLGKTPALEVTDGTGPSRSLSESQAIAYYVSDDELKGGSSELNQAQVLQWLSFADQDLLPAIFNFVFPILELMPASGDVTKNKKEVLRLLAILNNHLKTRTYFVGEGITLADISICCNLILLLERGLLKTDRDVFPYLLRWFDTIINQKNVKEVIGNITLCEKLQPLPKDEPGLKLCGFFCFWLLLLYFRFSFVLYFYYNSLFFIIIII